MKKCFLIFMVMALISLAKAQNFTQTYTYHGKIGESPIVLKFYIPINWYNFDSGEYYYVKYKKPISFKGSEPVTGKEKVQRLYEAVNGKRTGYFIFDSPNYFLMDVVGNPRLTGKWYSMDGSKVYRVVLDYRGNR